VPGIEDKHLEAESRGAYDEVCQGEAPGDQHNERLSNAREGGWWWQATTGWLQGEVEG